MESYNRGWKPHHGKVEKGPEIENRAPFYAKNEKNTKNDYKISLFRKYKNYSDNFEVNLEAFGPKALDLLLIRVGRSNMDQIRS